MQYLSVIFNMTFFHINIFFLQYNTVVQLGTAVFTLTHFPEARKTGFGQVKIMKEFV